MIVKPAEFTEETPGFAEQAAAFSLAPVFRHALDHARESGLPPTLTVADLAAWGPRFSAQEIEDLVVPKRTLARRKANREPLTPEETDKALRLARISAEADRVFGDPSKADRWLRRPNPVFHERTPLELLKTEVGGNMVETLLHQIDHGIFI